MPELRPGTPKFGFLVKNYPYSEILRTLGPDLGLHTSLFKFSRFFEKNRVQKLRFPRRNPGSGRYREVREAHRNRFHLFSSRLARGARSYDQKTKKS